MQTTTSQSDTQSVTTKSQVVKNMLSKIPVSSGDIIVYIYDERREGFIFDPSRDISFSNAYFFDRLDYVLARYSDA